MIPCLFRCMAPHIYPPIHQNPIFHSFFPTTFSNSIPLLPPHPRITKYFLNEHTINFPPLFPTFQTSCSHFQPANHLPPSVPFFNEQTNSPRPQKSHHFPLKNSTDFATFFTSPLRTASQKHCSTTFSIKTSPLGPQQQALIHRLISPPENRQSPPHRKCYPHPHQPKYLSWEIIVFPILVSTQVP